MAVRPTSLLAAARILSLTAAILTAVGGCSAVRPPVDDRDLRLEAATAAFGGGFEYLMVESSGPLADRLLAAAGPLAGSAPVVRELARRLAPAAERPVRILVTGWDPENTARVVVAALEAQRSKLPHLELLYLGEPRMSSRIREAVEAAGGRFRFAPYRG